MTNITNKNEIVGKALELVFGGNGEICHGDACQYDFCRIAQTGQNLCNADACTYDICRVQG